MDSKSAAYTTSDTDNALGANTMGSAPTLTTTTIRTTTGTEKQIQPESCTEDPAPALKPSQRPRSDVLPLPQRQSIVIKDHWALLQPFCLILCSLGLLGIAWESDLQTEPLLYMITTLNSRIDRQTERLFYWITTLDAKISGSIVGHAAKGVDVSVPSPALSESIKCVSIILCLWGMGTLLQSGRTYIFVIYLACVLIVALCSQSLELDARGRMTVKAPLQSIVTLMCIGFEVLRLILAFITSRWRG